jgi:micrococcal nuclease
MVLIQPTARVYATLASLAVLLVAGLAATTPTIARHQISRIDSVTRSIKEHTQSGTIRPLVAVDVLRVIDGDTVEVRAHVWLNQAVITRVRLRHVDAPELRSRCPAETRRAQDSRDHLADMLRAQKVYLADVGQDKYGGRVLGSLVDQQGADIGSKMLTAGQAVAYAGGRRTSACVL